MKAVLKRVARLVKDKMDISNLLAEASCQDLNRYFTKRTALWMHLLWAMILLRAWRPKWLAIIFLRLKIGNWPIKTKNTKSITQKTISNKILPQRNRPTPPQNSLFIFIFFVEGRVFHARINTHLFFFVYVSSLNYLWRTFLNLPL